VLCIYGQIIAIRKFGAEHQLSSPMILAFAFYSLSVYNTHVASCCTVTVVDPDGRRRSLDVLAGSYDAAHVYFTHAKTHRGSGLPIPTTETMFEVAAQGRLYKVTGVKLRDWIKRERTRRNGPQGYLFSKRPVMD